MATTGTQVGQNLPIGKTDSETASRESVIWSFIKNRQFPSYIEALRTGDVGWREVRSIEKDKNGGEHMLTLRVMPRYFELGTDSDPILMPMWPATAQSAADMFNAILPSQKIVDIIWNNADAQLPIGPPPGFKIPGADMEQTPSWIAHNAIIQDSLKRYGKDALMAGGKKDVVVGPGLNGSKVAIYSTPFKGEGNPLRAYAPELVDNPWEPGKKFHPPLHQPYSTIHHSRYSDYSHGVRLVSRHANVDGGEVDIASLFLDPILHPLVSDQGIFYPSFPNMGLANKMAVTYGIGPVTEAAAPPSGPAADPIDPASAPKQIIPFVALSPQEEKRTIVGGAIGLAAGLLVGFSWPWLVGSTLAGAWIGKDVK